MLVLAALLAPALLAPAVFAQKPEVIVEVDKTRIDLGDSIDYRITLNNFGEQSAPKFEPPADVDVESLGAQQQSFTSIVIINGRRVDSGRNGVTYAYRLTPRKAGTLVLPAPVASDGGKELTGRSVSIVVTPETPQDLVALEVSADRPTVYPLQTFAVTLRVFVKALPKPHANRDPTTIDLNRNARALTIPWATDQRIPAGIQPARGLSEWLGPLQRDDGRGFRINDFGSRGSLFLFENVPSTFQLTSRKVRRNDLAGKPADYWEYSLSRAFTAQKTGKYSFGPAVVKGRFIADVKNNEAEVENVRARSNVAVVEVKEVPTENRPDHFIGAIGNFTVDAELTPKECRVGDPLTFTVWLRGTGLMDIGAPDLAKVPELAANFRVYEGSSQPEGKARKFTYSLRPKHAQIKQVPAVPLAYFDVDKGEYVTVSTEAIPIRVTAADVLAARDVAKFSPDKTGSASLEENKSGLVANVVEPGDLRSDNVALGPWLGAIGALAATFMMLAASRYFLARRAQRVGIDVRNAARIKSDSYVNAAKAAFALGDNATACEACRKSVATLVAAHAGVDAEGITPNNAREILAASQTDEAHAKEVVALLETFDGARYGADAIDGNELLGRVEGTNRWLTGYQDQRGKPEK